MRYALSLAVLAAPAFADSPVVENVTVDGDRFSVTLSHPDTGRDAYADGREVLDAVRARDNVGGLSDELYEVVLDTK